MNPADIPSMDLVRRVFSLHETPQGYPCEKKVGIGMVYDPDDQVYFTVPEPSQDPEKWGNWGKPHGGYLESEQVWTRMEDHPEWNRKYVQEQAKKYGNDPRWYWKEDADGRPTRMSYDAMAYAARNWELLTNGLHILINGELVYITGLHWAYLQWCKLDGSYPDYREKDRYWFYAWETVRNHSKMAGLIYTKHRRDGATSRCLFCLMMETIRTRNANSYIQSKTGKHAKEVIYLKKLVPMFDALPEFFKPQTTGYDRPQNGFIFNSPPMRGARRLDQREGINSSIMLAATDTQGAAIDGDKVFVVLIDESAKIVRTDIEEAVRVIVPTLVANGKYRGKIIMPTTLEELEGDKQPIFRRMWDGSAPSLAKHSNTGTTKTKLIRLFFPAWFGLYDEVAFIGRFGESIIDTPTEDQYKWLCQNHPTPLDEAESGFGKTREELWKTQGAWAYLAGRRKDLEDNPKELLSEIRKYPVTPEEGFTASPSDSPINAFVTNAAIQKLSALSANRTPYHESLWKSYRIEPIKMHDEKLDIGKSLQRPMRLVPDPKGDWLCRNDWFHSCNGEWIPNQFHIDGAGKVSVSPSGGKFSVGVDPIDSDKSVMASKSASLSNFAVVVWWRWDPVIDGDKPPGQNRTHSPVAIYKRRKEKSDEMCFELCKALLLVGSKAHIENNRGAVIFKFMDLYKMGAMIRLRPRSTYKSDTPQTLMKPTRGTPTSEDLYMLGFPAVNDWVTEYSSPENCPFIEVWREFHSVSPGRMQPFDLFVALMFAILDANNGILAEPEKKRDIGTESSGHKTLKRIGYRPDDLRISRL